MFIYLVNWRVRKSNNSHPKSSNTCYFVVLFHLLRYILLVFFNSRKAIFKSKRNKEVKIQLFCLKFITSFIPYISIMLFLIVIFAIYHLATYFGLGSTCFQDGFLLYSRIYSYVIAIIQTLLFASIVLFDLLNNWKLLFNPKTFNLKAYFINEDPYSFRFEMILYLIVFFVNSCFVFTGILIDIIYPSLPKNTATEETLHLFYEIQRLIPDGLLIIVVFGFPLTITIIKYILNLIRKSKSKEYDIEGLENFLNDELGYKLFFDFAKNEWSLENIKFWSAVQEWKKNPTKERSLEIYDGYLSGPLSPLEINVPRKECNDVWKIINELNIEQQLPLDLFDKLEFAVRSNLSDTYSRLMLTDEFSLFVKKHKFQDKLLKEFK